jgi:cell division septum initiation protein DivIVA
METLQGRQAKIKEACIMPEFEITMGGYDIKEVEQLVAMVEKERDSPTENREGTLEALRLRDSDKFPRRFRGYSKIQVRNYIGDRLREMSH